MHTHDDITDELERLRGSINDWLAVQAAFLAGTAAALSVLEPDDRQMFFDAIDEASRNLPLDELVQPERAPAGLQGMLDSLRESVEHYLADPSDS